MPIVSVVTPVYNGERFLATAIESVQSQTLRDWELVLVNDGSRDGSMTVVSRFQEHDPRIRMVSQPNAGVAAARNRGAAEADPASVYLLFLDQDDMLEPTALDVLVQALEADPDAAGAHGYARDIDADGHWLANSVENALHVRLGLQGRRVTRWPIPAPTTFAVAALRCPFPSTGVVLLRRAVFDRANGFDEYVAPADDWDMWLRLTSQQHIAFVPEYVLRYRWHAANASHGWEAVGRAAERCWRKHLMSTSLTETQRTLMWRGFQYSRMWLCRSRMQWAIEQFRRGDVIGALKQLRRVPMDVAHFTATLVGHKPAGHV